MSDEEDYGFEYSDESDDDQDVDIENAYYTAKGLCSGQQRAYTKKKHKHNDEKSRCLLVTFFF